MNQSHLQSILHGPFSHINLDYFSLWFTISCAENARSFTKAPSPHVLPCVGPSVGRPKSHAFVTGGGLAQLHRPSRFSGAGWLCFMVSDSCPCECLQAPHTARSAALVATPENPGSPLCAVLMAPVGVSPAGPSGCSRRRWSGAAGRRGRRHHHTDKPGVQTTEDVHARHVSQFRFPASAVIISPYCREIPDLRRYVATNNRDA